MIDVDNWFVKYKILYSK